MVSKARGKVCRRCRLIKEDIGNDDRYPDFCENCAEIVAQTYPETLSEGFDD
ncbi:MAG: zinc finger domain-containing protein [Lactobacillaceae bacterium]